MPRGGEDDLSNTSDSTVGIIRRMTNAEYAFATAMRPGFAVARILLSTLPIRIMIAVVPRGFNATGAEMLSARFSDWSQ
jgi:hypothetical protein